MVASVLNRRFIIPTIVLTLVALFFIGRLQKWPVPEVLRPVGVRRPIDVPVIGLVFFGRKSRVEILKCYLERNLVDNGGWLDEIHWVMNTDHEDDLLYLDEIIASSPRHKRLGIDSVGRAGYVNAWSLLERGKLYVKIDDDVVWMADDTIQRIVTSKIQHPEYFLVSANVINHPLMGWIHYHLGAFHPYLPESNETAVLDFSRQNSGSAHASWRYTDYPYWQGPTDLTFDLGAVAPYDGHRWLRLADENTIHRTPASHIEYGVWGTGAKSWAIAAQTHYSFLENLSTNQLEVYRFNRTWLANHERLSINFIALWADEVLDNLPMSDSDDEEWITKILPKQLGKSVAVDSNALATHFSYGWQIELEKTDLLARYNSYARENVCDRPL